MGMTGRWFAVSRHWMIISPMAPILVQRQAAWATAFAMGIWNWKARSISWYTNFLGKHTLHGGSKGMGVQVWSFDKVEENAVHMSITLPDGEMGFPGNLTIKIVYSLLEGGVLDMAMSARTDATYALQSGPPLLFQP